MKLYYYDSKPKNFGDQLNTVLWNRLLGDLENDFKDNYTFVGVGSLIDERLIAGDEKIIFGAGVRDLSLSYKNMKLKIEFVRGPISSKALSGCPYITDAAYCLGLLPTCNPIKKIFEVSFIPYFRHLHLINWKVFSRLTNINVILPNEQVAEIIKKIRQSKFVLSSAMHGAIVSDIYRVPWHRVIIGKHGYESKTFSNLKWDDWAQSIGITQMSLTNVKLNLRGSDSLFSGLTNTALTFYLISKLESVSDFQLSNDHVLSEIFSHLNDKVRLFRSNYGKSTLK